MKQTQYSLHISVLGRFSIDVNSPKADRSADDSARGGAALRQRSFLQYLCVFHDREVSQEEIIEAVFESDEDVGDPVNTLKNSLYRARQLLESLGCPDAKSLLRYRRGFYSWDPEVEIKLDIEEFDELYDAFYSAENQTTEISSAIKALELYEGEFLSNAVSSSWTLSLRTYYHSKYMKLAHDATAVLYQLGRYKEAMEICQKATTSDPFNEENQLLMMMLLDASGLSQQAVAHYEQLRALFMDQLGVTPSQELSDYYHRLTRREEPRELDLTNIRGQLLESDINDGAYFCEYTVFQNIYRMISRSIMRSGQAIQLAMTVVYDEKGQHLPANRCAVPMDALYYAIRRALRTGDVFTRFSRDQYLILLMSSNYENASMALERVLKLFYGTPGGSGNKVKYSVLPVLPSQPVGDGSGWQLSEIKKK